MSNIRCPMCDYPADECACEDRYGRSEPAGRPVRPHRSGGGLPPEEPEGPSHVPYYLRHSEDDLPVSGEEFLRRYPQLASTKTTDSEPAEGAGHLDAGDALRAKLADPETMQRVTERAAERQDAMLERRDALEALMTTENERQVWRTRIRGDGSPPGVARLAHDVDVLLRALSRTSDEGTGCVVPEAVRRLPYELRREAENRCGCCDPDATMPGCDCMNLDDARGEGRDQEKLDIARRLDRAIAEQGEQSRIPVGLARLVSEWLTDFPEGGDLDGFDQQAMMERAGIIEAMEITEIPCGDSCSCDEYGADVGDTCYRVTALGDKCLRIAAAPQPEHGESDER